MPVLSTKEGRIILPENNAGHYFHSIMEESPRSVKEAFVKHAINFGINSALGTLKQLPDFDTPILDLGQAAFEIHRNTDVLADLQATYLGIEHDEDDDLVPVDFDDEDDDDGDDNILTYGFADEYAEADDLV